ncbi:MAG: hypothetical protein MUC43_13335 [Pirellula sp.]|jgi:uncharacterized membrane protein|nr:hypothetical protein [Pirellula sp.]
MSYSSPYESPASPSGYLSEGEIRKVPIDPIGLLKRGKELLGDQYWLFLAITWLAMIIGSMVPFGIVMGPLMVGVYLCMKEREQGKQVELGTLFTGFDRFIDALIAMLLQIAISFVLIIPVGIIIGIGAAILAAVGDNGNDMAAGIGIVGILVLVPVILIVALLAYLPSVFCFQLIADRGVTGLQAITLSFKAAWKNLFGLIIFQIVVGIISALLSILCFVPVIFFFPIVMAAAFVLYRDIFPAQSGV